MKRIILSILIVFFIFGLFSCSNTTEQEYNYDETYNLIDQYIIKLLDNSAYNKPIWNIEAINSNKAAKWNYIDGCMISSLLDLYKQTKEEKYYDYAKSFIDYYVSSDGSILGYKIEDYNLDNINGGRVLFELYEKTNENKYKIAMDTLMSQLDAQPRTSEGNFWHKQIYTNQVWLDGLYMAQPFYLLYDTKFNNKANYEDILSQYNNVYDKMYNPDKGLYYHGYDNTKKIFWADINTGLSENFWLRSMGWYVISLVDVYSFIDDSNQNMKNRFKELIEITLDGLYRYLDTDNNMFYQVIDQMDREGNYLETSGSLMISYASLKASRLGVVDKKYEELGLKVFHGVCKRYLTNQNGNLNLGGICITAGLGPETNLKRNGTFEYYISEEIVENDAKGVAPLLMAYTEIKKLG